MRTSKQALKRARRRLGLEVNRKPLDAFAWPGGYPLAYADGFGCLLCPDCASAACADDDKRFQPQAVAPHYEGAPIICEGCNVAIESAYGEPGDGDA